MRVLIIEFVLLLVVLTGQSLTQALPSLPEADKVPFVGTWKANADKSRPKLDKVQASYVRTMSREGEDVVFSSRTKKAHSSKFSENHYKIRCDGIRHRVQCGNLSCMTSCTYVTATRVEGDTASADGKTSYWTREVSPDGQEMLVSGYRDKARTELESVQVNDRVK